MVTSEGFGGKQKMHRLREVSVQVRIEVVRECLRRWIAGSDSEDPETLDFVVGCAAGWPGFHPEGDRWVWSGPGEPPRFLWSYENAELLVPTDCSLEVRRDPERRYVALVRSPLEDREPTPAIGRSAASAVALGAIRARSRARWEGRPIFQAQ